MTENLYSRLRPQYRKVLISNKKYYSVQRLIAKMKYLSFVSELTVEDVKHLLLYGSNNRYGISWPQLSNIYEFDKLMFKDIKID